ncbi:MAG: methyltransferase domain-containing protein [Candidatus Korobacteraceae bacterium]
MAVNALIRKLIPSTVLVARNPLFSLGSHVIDGTYGRYAEWRTGVKMPPLRYIVRTGVGNNILFPHFYYATAGHKQWEYFFSAGLANLNSNIVDIGCGCGKSAVILRDFSYADAHFSGHYYGFDIDPALVEWCANHFPADRFTFALVHGKSKVYPSSGQPQEKRSLAACADNSIDLVFSQSLFSHLLEEDLANYIAESLRVLKPGGAMCMTFFCLEDLAAQGLLGNRWKFRHQVGRAYVENLEFPEAAVAYEKATIVELAKSLGFFTADVLLPSHQSSLLCKKSKS